MSERGRIKRVLENASLHLQEMRSTRNPLKQQASWEDFLLDWKRSIELMRSFCVLNKLDDVRTRRYEERLSSSVLNYAWEARNAEEHDITGSINANPGSMKINFLDRSKALYIKKMSIGVPGQPDVLDMTNGVVCIEEGRLEMKPVLGPGKKTIVDPPIGLSPQEVCVEAMEFASSFYREIFSQRPA